MYYLQARWKQEGNILVYYGLRNKENLLKNTIKLNKKQSRIIGKLPCDIKDNELKILGSLVNTVIVEKCNIKKIPKYIDEAVFCNGCGANDFIIPGLEFDEKGNCPMCQTAEETAELKSLLPIMNEFPRAKYSRFDVALFYTGGKDSTYLLYYLAKVQGLRVLALTWEIPYMSDSARTSIENAKHCFENVEFISRYVSKADLGKIYASLYGLSGNTCACPSLAYVLFYPELAANRVPYFAAANEPAQVLGLYYNGMAPKFAYGIAENKFVSTLINIGRLLTLRPSLKKGQLQTLVTLKRLTRRRGGKLGYKNELVDNIAQAINVLPQMTRPLKRALRGSSFSGNIPAFVQVDLDYISGGKYNWENVKNIIQAQCGWEPPQDNNKGLHTSCCVEKCKEHSQLLRFYNMESRMIPFSAIEISIASRGANLTIEQAIEEIKSSMGFSLEEPPECQRMREYIRG